MIDTKFYQELEKRKKFLIYRRNKLESMLQEFPGGIIRSSKEHGYKRYYLCNENSSEKGVYITDKKLILELSNKNNVKQAINYTNRELHEIEKLLAYKSDNKILESIKSIQIGKLYYKPYNYIERIKDEYIKKWLSTPYEPKGFSKYAPKLYSMSGKRVRSKSEGKIIDCLEQRNIPYLYEFPVVIDGVTFHPDVKCLNPRSFEIVYWEHWGSMDDPVYVNEQLERLEEYKKAGIILGKNLFVTMETAAIPLTPETIFDFIDNHLS